MNDNSNVINAQELFKANRCRNKRDLGISKEEFERIDEEDTMWVDADFNIGYIFYQGIDEDKK